MRQPRSGAPRIARLVAIAALAHAGAAAVAHGADDAGTTSVFAVGAGNRALAMGGAYAGIAEDAGGWMWNAGGLGFAPRTQLQIVQTAPDEAGFVESWAGVVLPSWRWGSLTGSYRQFGVDDVEGRDARNLPTGALSSRESEFALGYGHVLGDALSLGAVAKVRRQELGVFSGGGLGADLGLMLKPAVALRLDARWAQELTMGFAVRNALQPAVRLDLEQVPDPRAARFGFAWRGPWARGTTRVALDLERTAGRAMRGHAGLEISPHPLMDLRIGLDGGHFTAGTGFRIGHAELDYAFEDGALSAIHRAGVTLHLGSTVEESREHALKVREDEMERRLAAAFDVRQRQRIDGLMTETRDALAAHDWELALDRLVMVRALEPANGTARKLEATCLLERATQMEQDSDFAGAAVVFGQIVAADSTDSVAIAGAQRCRAASDRRAERTTELRGRFAAGLDAFASERFADARREFLAILDAKPQDGEARAMLMRVESSMTRRAEAAVAQAQQLIALGRFDDAQRLLDEARSLDPRTTGLIASGTLLARARAQAATAAERKAQSLPKPARALTAAERRELTQLYQRGLTAMQQGRADEAVRYWELAWSKNPDDVGVRRSLKQEYLARGMEAFASGRLSEAVAQWEKALRMDPTDERARAYLARAQEHLARTRELSTR